MPILAFPVADDSTPLPDVPPLVQLVLLRFLTPILAWLSAHLYQALLARCAAHPLVRLAQGYDPSAVVTTCAAYYHRTGPGKPPTYTVNTLVRAEIVRAWAASCSDPALECLLASNLIVRWYVGLPLLGPTPDHTTLNRFHAWLTAHHPNTLFRDVLTFLCGRPAVDRAARPIVSARSTSARITPISAPRRRSTPPPKGRDCCVVAGRWSRGSPG